MTTNHILPFPEEKFLKWVVRNGKRGGEGYKYIDNQNCLIGQFLKSAGYRNYSVAPSIIYLSNKRKMYLPDVINEIALGRPHTFPAAAQRAQALLSSRNPN